MSNTIDETAVSPALASQPIISPATGAAVRPMRKDAARNRELLLASARVVFAQRGADASLDDIAHHAGLGVGTAYRHFGNKYELLTALMDQIVEQFVLTAEYTLTIEDPWQSLVVFFERALEMQVNDRGLREVLLGFHESAMFDEIHDRVSAVLTELLARAQRSGQIGPDIEVGDLGVIISMLCAAADVTGGDNPQLWRRYLALCLEGLRPGRAPLPEKALDEAQVRTAMLDHKRSMSRNW
jgi:AcrR family transcriptional regulator